MGISLIRKGQRFLQAVNFAAKICYISVGAETRQGDVDPVGTFRLNTIHSLFLWCHVMVPWYGWTVSVGHVRQTFPHCENKT